MYTPLFAEPEILAMLREWQPHALENYVLAQDEKRDPKKFQLHLDEIFISQIGHIITGSQFPGVMSSDHSLPYPSQPLLGHLAIYGINLVLLRILLNPPLTYTFKENLLYEKPKSENQTDCTRHWDRLTALWRTWFTLDGLKGLAAVMVAERQGDEITLTLRQPFKAPPDHHRLHTLLGVGLALADDISAGLAGQVLAEGEGRLFGPSVDPSKLLEKEKLLLPLDEFLRDVRNATDSSMHNEGDESLLARFLERSLYLLLRQLPHSTEAEKWPLVFHWLRKLSRHNLIVFDGGYYPFHPGMFMEAMHVNPKIFASWFTLLRDILPTEIFHKFGRDLARHFPSGRMINTMRNSPEADVQWLLILRDSLPSEEFRRFGLEWLERQSRSTDYRNIFSTPDTLLPILRIVRALDQPQFFDKHLPLLKTSLLQWIDQDIDRFSITELGDLIWLAKKMGEPSIAKAIKIRITQKITPRSDTYGQAPRQV